jgi:hypothetical protein
MKELERGKKIKTEYVLLIAHFLQEFSEGGEGSLCDASFS